MMAIVMLNVSRFIKLLLARQLSRQIEPRDYTL